MNIFKLRVRKQWQLNSKLFKSVADWTVLLYLLVPAVLFIYYLYRETVLKGEFGVFEVIPLPLVIFVLMLITSGGYIRSFIEPGDRVFLIQHHRQFRKLKALSLFYSIIKQGLKIGLLLGFFSVVYIFHYQQDISGLIDLSLLLLIANMVFTLIHLRFNRKLVQFLLNFIQIVLLTIFAVTLAEPISTVTYSVLYILLCFVYWIKYVRSTKHFDKQIDLEIQSTFKFQMMIFAASQELKSLKPSKLPVRSPYLFKDRIFKKDEDFILDLLSKTIIRHRKYVWGYIRLVTVIIGLSFALPLWADVILVGLAYIMLKSWIESLVFEIKSHSIFVIYKLEDQEWLQAGKTFSIYLAGFPVLFIVLIIVVTELVTYIL
ncbi:ABC transporter permease [Ureibacillus sp. MALMAid1270]|uniref:ABC transporter permease n=1 Tax=Ureibacillus sp. MALMAid1270 TaxID=3411629 RepID=UPI003BA5F44E